MTTDTEELFDRAIDFLDRGQLQEAGRLLERITQLDPKDADAWLMLGSVCGEMGDIPRAMDCCRRAIAHDRNMVDAYIVQAHLFTAQGLPDEAATTLESALEHDPDYAEAWTMLGALYGQLGSCEKAVQCSREAIRLAPEQAAGHVNLCNALVTMQCFEEAGPACARAVELDPDNPGIWSVYGNLRERNEEWQDALDAYQRAVSLDASLAGAHTGLGRVLKATGDLPGAERSLQTALGIDPSDINSHVGLGSVYRELQQREQAEPHLLAALQIEPDCAEACIEMGNLLQDQGRYSEALAYLERAITAHPENAAIYHNSGVILNKLNRYAEAIKCYDKAIALRPDFVESHWNKAFICLLLGDFENGWQEYEWRLQQKENINRPFTKPVWDGSPLAGRTILVHDEQGFGDSFQFVRYLPLVRECGGHVIFECRQGLGPVLKDCDGFDHIIERKSPHDVPDRSFDVHIHLLTLPGLFRTGINPFPGQEPYIRPDPDLVAHWQGRLAADTNFRIGICWTGSPGHTNNLSRSCQLAGFSVLAEMPGVSLYSLQKGAGSEQADNLPQGFNLIRLDRELDIEATFVDTAAVMMSLDLVISIDTATVHLAGALGRPVWALLCATPDWRWLLDRSDSPWYPTMRLFRQETPGNWEGIFKQVKTVLANKLERRN